MTTKMDCKKNITTCVQVLILLVLCTKGVEMGNNIKYQFFDDYLISIAAPKQDNEILKPAPSPVSRSNSNHNHSNNPPSDDEDLSESSGHGSDDEGSNESQEEEYSTLDILGYFRDVPRQHWSCCMLGKLAGDKGFSCHVNFYAARIAVRNHNRAHNRKMLFQGSQRIPQWGRGIMHTFSQCIHRHREQFHKCCYAATVEQRERNRWHRYRHTDRS